jgi:hypothetical protein
LLLMASRSPVKATSEDTDQAYAGFEIVARKVFACAATEPRRSMRIHLDDAAIQSAFTSLALRIHLRRGARHTGRTARA